MIKSKDTNTWYIPETAAGDPRIQQDSKSQTLSPAEAKEGRVQPTPLATSEHQENTKSLLPEFL